MPIVSRVCRAAVAAMTVAFFAQAFRADAQPRNRTHVPQPADMSIQPLGQGSNDIYISDGGIKVGLRRDGNRFSLVQIQRPGDPPMLYRDQAARQAGAGSTGNPLAVEIKSGRYKGIFGIDTFYLNRLYSGPRHVLAYLQHDTMPMQIALDVSVQGNVIKWQGQALWNGTEPIEADIYFPLLSRVRFDGPRTDRAIFAQTSGSVRGPLGSVNYSHAYMGNLSSPTFLVEGGGRGIAVIDDNMADFAVDPGAASRRSYIVGNTFPVPQQAADGGEQGPFAGILHTRVFRPIADFGGETTYNAAEAQGPEYFRKLGDAVDLGPVRMFAYAGTWKAGAEWLRAQRRDTPMRTSPAKWYRNTTFLAEDGLDNLWRSGKNFLELPAIMDHKRKGGADFMHVTGFSDGEMLGIPPNMQNRGDYSLIAQNMGGVETMRKGIEALHRSGGHVIFYVEGMIMWRRSRIGRTQGESFALMNPDGTYTEHYRGFWHACPADRGFQNWFAKTLADVVRTTGVDGFFIDSSLATYNHRCFNPKHNHPHPDVWNWGIREMLRRVREEVDKVNPETILIVEGAGDMGREFVDGFLSHTHAWSQETFTLPFVRFLHPQMRAFESWGASGATKPMGLEMLQRLHIWNSVNGHRIYSHAPSFDKLAPLSLRTRRYYDAFPEICDAQMSTKDVGCSNCIAQMFEGAEPIVTVGNTTAKDTDAVMTIPVSGAVMVDRVDYTRVPIVNGKATLKLGPYEFRAFDVKP